MFAICFEVDVFILNSTIFFQHFYNNILQLQNSLGKQEKKNEMNILITEI
jgi:hypothetical protein